MAVLVHLKILFSNLKKNCVNLPQSKLDTLVEISESFHICLKTVITFEILLILFVLLLLFYF